MDSAWVPLASLDTPKRKATIEYINTRQHELAYLINNSAPVESLVFQSVNGNIRCRRDGDSSIWIIGKSDVESEIKQVVDYVNDAVPEQGIVLLLGGSIGYGVAALIPYILQNPDLRVVVIEPTIDRILACLSFVDIRQALMTERLHFIVSEIYPDSILEKLEPLNIFQFEPLTLICSPELQGGVDKNELITKYTERVMTANDNRVELISELKSLPPVKDTVQRVLLINCWVSAPQEIHLQAINSFLTKRNIKTQRLNINRYRFDGGGLEFSRVVESHVTRLVREFQPDMILSFGYHAPHFVSREVYDALNVHWVQVITNIAYYDDTQYPGEHTFVIDEHLVSYFENRGYRNVHFVPLMADYTSTEPAQTNHRWPVVFVGNSLGMAPPVVEAFKSQWKERQALLAYIEDAEKNLSDFNQQLNLYDYLTDNPMPQVNVEKEQYSIFRYLLCQASAARRKVILEKIAPLGLALFGGDWEHYLPENSALRNCLQGGLPIKEEQKVFLHGSVFINIQSIGHVNGPNMRFFNAAGMGAFQVSDAPQFDCYLKSGHEMIYASSLDEYYDQIHYYLDHKDEMDTIRTNAQKRVNKDWTYDNWLDRVFETLGVV
jgi:glycosyl transferase family 1